MIHVHIPLQEAARRPLRVLTPDLSDRLTAVTEAWRALKQAGYQPTNQDLRLGTNKRPLLMLARGDARLQTKLSGVAIRINEDGLRSFVGRLVTVDVQWPLEAH